VPVAECTLLRAGSAMHSGNYHTQRWYSLVAPLFRHAPPAVMQHAKLARLNKGGLTLASPTNMQFMLNMKHTAYRYKDMLSNTV
jgi:hypothetical protein